MDAAEAANLKAYVDRFNQVLPLPLSSRLSIPRQSHESIDVELGHLGGRRLLSLR